MKKLAVLTFVFMLGAGPAFCQETIPSQVKKVILFSNQAQVKREATANVQEGLNQLLIELDAFDVDSDSVSAKVFGEGELLGVQLKDIFLKEPPQENIMLLEKKIEDLKDQKKGLIDKEGVLDEKKRFLNSVVEFSKTQVPEEMKTAFPSIDDLDKTLVFLGERLNGINENRASLDYKIRYLNKDIEALERELSTLRGSSRKSKKVIEIVFNSKKPQSLKLEASYIAYNAFWKPLYKVDIPTDLKDVSLIMFAKIMQKTGENWEDIKLSISNVIPLRGVGLPSLNSWFLDLYRVKRSEDKARALFAKQQSLSMEMLQDRAPLAEKEADFAYAEKKELPLSFEYDLSQILSIESKDKDTILPLLTKDIKGDFFYYAAPKLSPLTFLVCSAASDKELLSGPLNVYFVGRFVGKTHIAEKKPGEEFKFSLGADRSIKVKREKIKDNIKETFFKKIERRTIVREMQFKITVENLKQKSAKIKVLDNVPVSKTDKIEVKGLKIAPEPTKKDYQDREGVMLWEFELAPKAKKVIDIEFVITYPKDTPVSGL